MAPGRPGFVGQRNSGCGHATGQLGGDARVVRGGVPERLHGQGGAKPLPHPTVALQFGQHLRVAVRRGHDRHGRVVLGRRANHRRAADVDLLDQFVEADARLVGRCGEGIEVDHDQIERVDGSRHQLLAVREHAPIGQDAGVDPRVERLDAAVEHLREARDRGHVGDRQSGRSQRLGRAAGGDQLEAEAHQPRAELRQAGLVRDRQQRPPRAGHLLGRLRGVDADGSAVRPDRQRARQSQADGPRQQPVLDGVDAFGQRVLGVAGQDRHGLLEDDRSAVERAVGEVDGHAGDLHARFQRVLDRVRAGERRQQGRVEIDDRAGQGAQGLGPEQPHVAGQDDQLRARPPAEKRRARRRPPPAASTSLSLGIGTSSVSIPCSAAHSSAGAPAVGEDESYLGVESAAQGCRVQRLAGCCRSPRPQPRFDAPRRSSFAVLRRYADSE